MESNIAQVVQDLYSNEYTCGSIQHNLWYHFEGHRWVAEEMGYTLRQQLSSTVSDMYHERAQTYQTISMQATDRSAAKCYKEKASFLLKQSNKLKMVPFKDRLMSELSELFYCPEFLKRLDDAPNLLCFTNGVYDLNTHTFRAGKPDDYVSKCTGYAYTPTEDPEIMNDIKTFLSSILPSEETQHSLLQTLANMLHGTKNKEQIWVWRGVGGRGTLCTLLRKTLGDYYYELGVTALTKKSISNATPELVKGNGRRVIVVKDCDTKFRLNRLKDLQRQELINARGLYKDTIEYRPQFGIIVQSDDHVEGIGVKTVEFEFVERGGIETKFESDTRYPQQFNLVLLRICRESC